VAIATTVVPAAATAAPAIKTTVAWADLSALTANRVRADDCGEDGGTGGSDRRLGGQDVAQVDRAPALVSILHGEGQRCQPANDEQRRQAQHHRRSLLRGPPAVSRLRSAGSIGGEDGDAGHASRDGHQQERRRHREPGAAK